MKTITSNNNEYIKQLVKLHDKKYRDQMGMYLVEGVHLVSEAKEDLVTVLIINESLAVYGVENIVVTREIIKKVSQTSSPQNIIGVCSIKKKQLQYDKTKYLLLDNIQDPGNLGTLVRSALAFNVDYVVVDDGVDIYNDKFIRATQGAMFHIDIVKADLKETIKKLQEQKITVYGTKVDNGTNLRRIMPPLRYALVLGNEGNGVKKDIMDMVDANIYIPMNRQLESLNVAVAGSIIMYYLQA